MATTVETRYTRRARYYSSAQAFNMSGFSLNACTR